MLDQCTNKGCTAPFYVIQHLLLNQAAFDVCVNDSLWSLTIIHEEKIAYCSYTSTPYGDWRTQSPGWKPQSMFIKDTSVIVIHNNTQKDLVKTLVYIHIAKQNDPAVMSTSIEIDPGIMPSFHMYISEGRDLGRISYKVLTKHPVYRLNPLLYKHSEGRKLKLT